MPSGRSIAARNWATELAENELGVTELGDFLCDLGVLGGHSPFRELHGFAGQFGRLTFAPAAR